MKSFKMLFFSILISSTLITVSSYSWLGMWVGLEINLLSIIPLMLNSSNTLTAEAMIKYFVTQAMASMILFASILSILINSYYSNTSPQILLMIALLTKMGAAPFHFWFPEVIEGLSWTNVLIVLTWQKIAPMMILIYSSPPTLMIESISLICLICSGVFIINQSSLRKFLAFSSINNMGWMLMTIITQENLWMIYFFIYSVSTASVMLIFNLNHINSFSDLSEKFMMNQPSKIFMALNFLNLASIPPMIMFLPKWLTMEVLIKSEMYMLSTLMVTLTLITTYMYIQGFINSNMLTKQIKLIKHENLNLKVKMINVTTISSFFPAIIMFNWY